MIIIAAGFDLYFADPVGNGKLTSNTYYKFTERIFKIANKICNGKLIFILEGGYSLIGLPHCVLAVIRALLGEGYEQPTFEKLKFLAKSEKENIDKIKKGLKKLLADYWISLK
jgi:acetoin utilization deacetylase AcuC-like enzyme